MSIRMYQQSGYTLPLPDKSADLIIADPPFWGTQGSYYGGDLKGQLSDGTNTDPKVYWENLTQSTREMKRVLKDDGSLIIHIGQGEYPNLNSFESEHVVFCVKELGLTLTSEIFWEFSQRMFSFDHLHGEYQIFRHYTKSSNYVRNQYDIASLNPASWKIAFIENDPELSKIASMEHGFPVELPLRMIRCFTQEGAVVLDPFSGTGSTNVAAEMLRRNSVYIDVSSVQNKLALARFKKRGYIVEQFG